MPELGIATDELKQLINKKIPLFVLDLRQKKNYLLGHVEKISKQ